jgi:hypothetical protein
MSKLNQRAVVGTEGLGRGPRDFDDPGWSEAPAWYVKRVERAALIDFVRSSPLSRATAVDLCSRRRTASAKYGPAGSQDGKT